MIRRFKRWANDRKWFRTDPSDSRPFFDASVVFQAADQDEAEALFDRMLDAIGCAEHDGDQDSPCPHFRVGGVHMMEDD